MTPIDSLPSLCFASFQIDTGAPLEVIQKTLGHGNKATTEIYAKMAMDPVRASVEKAIEAMVGVRLL